MTTESKNMVLGTLKNVGDWAPTPLFSSLASTALSVYEVAKGLRGWGDVKVIRLLADRTVNVTFIVIVGLQHEGRKGIQHTSDVDAELRLLLEELKKIEAFTRGYEEKRKWLSRMLSYRVDKRAIIGHMGALNCTLANFGIKSTIDPQVLADRLSDEHKKFLDSIAQQALMGKSKEALTREMYGSLLPSRHTPATSARYSSAARGNGSLEPLIPTSSTTSPKSTHGHDGQGRDRDVLANNYTPGNKRVKTSSKRVVNVNSGGSYSFVYNGDGRG
ncbi:hypothetical protein AX16_002546 [Volvariella volvacea WC 439]|nr:hypothetical protein AX16_002546 [Volvariella volvacea WC 439]